MNMDKMFFCIAVLFFLAFSVMPLSWAEESLKKIGDVSVPENMDSIQEGNVSVLVPKGGMLEKKSSFMVTEPPDQYVARRFLEFEESFKRIDKELEEQKRELKELRDVLDEMKKSKVGS